MKKHSFFVTTCMFMFLLLSFWVTAEETGNNPVAVSPGSENEMVTVWQSCPTFSWSAVDQAASYQVAVFESMDGKIVPYESMAVIASPVISKQIHGPALSCSLSAEEHLKTGSMYAWYVQALDASGNIIGSWSSGRIFQVEQEIQFVGIQEKLTEILKSYGVNDDTAANVLNDLKSEVIAANTPGISGVLGDAEPNYTLYGYNAGVSITTAIYGTFIGDHAGSSIISGGSNTHLGHYAGYSSVGENNTFVGSGSGIGSGTTINGAGMTFIGKDAGAFNEYADEGTYIGASAGYTNDAGSRYTLLGYKAGYYKNGYNGSPSNTFIGCESGYNTTSGNCNNFFGYQAGYSNTSGNNSTYIGYYAGYGNTGDGDRNNTFLGHKVGYANTSGNNNTFIGASTGYSNTGSLNVFLGYKAGYNENGDNKLYIANSDTSSPLIYGEFDNNTITVHGKLGIGTNTPDYPIELETTYETAAFVAARTSGAQDFLSATESYAQLGSESNHPVRILANNTWKMQINADNSLSMANGASCTTGGVWTNASSRTLKENIEDLTSGEAMAALFRLNPVKYNYKVEKTDKHVGFIAEDVPELVAAADRKGLSPMDITAVLTKVVQELQEENREYKKNITELQERVATLEEK